MFWVMNNIHYHEVKPGASFQDHIAELILAKTRKIVKSKRLWRLSILLHLSFCDSTTCTNVKDNIYFVTISLQLAAKQSSFLTFSVCGAV